SPVVKDIFSPHVLYFPRMDLINKPVGQTESSSFAPLSHANQDTRSQPLKHLNPFLRHLPVSGSTLPILHPMWAQLVESSRINQRLLRTRRHVHTGSRGGHHHPHPAQLMRVGCVLGTCQVQNLSHRLYQLIGQSGREDSSPMNPKSPHSYG
uniref:Adrenomedullin 2b n=1 Tax=Gouania willdenowi TaxID=441366 RepID=A0A8C5EX74_GOUWI